MKKLFALLFSLLFVTLLSGKALAANPRVQMTTNYGVIVLELDAAKAPKTVENFLAYVQSGFYDGTVFHRVIDGFMIQGGGFTPNMQQKSTRAPIANEAKNGLKNLTGSIAMARTNDPNSATSQFFINLADNAPLDYPSFDGWGYAVFGKVVDGMEVVRKIAGVEKKFSAGSPDRTPSTPVKPVLIESVKLVIQ